MTDDDWTIRVLEKLRKLANDGYMKSFVGWSYDNDSSKNDENRALLRLETEKVITAWSDESGDFIPDKHGVLVTAEENFGAFDLTNGNISKDAIAGNFDGTVFRNVCDRFGISPTDELYIARLAIIGIGTPEVRIGKNTYTLRSLQEGKNKELFISIIAKHPERRISLNAIRKMEGFEHTSNLNKLLENSLFSHGAPLAPFLTLTKDSIIFHPMTQLTIDQVSLIKNRAK